MRLYRKRTIVTRRRRGWHPGMTTDAVVEHMPWFRRSAQASDTTSADQTRARWFPLGEGESLPWLRRRSAIPDDLATEQVRRGWFPLGVTEDLAWRRKPEFQPIEEAIQDPRRSPWFAGLILPESLAWVRKRLAWPEETAPEFKRCNWFAGLAVVTGPYYVANADLWCAGGVAGQVYQSGAGQGDVYVAGASVGQLFGE